MNIFDEIILQESMIDEDWKDNLKSAGSAIIDKTKSVGNAAKSAINKGLNAEFIPTGRKTVDTLVDTGIPHGPRDDSSLEWRQEKRTTYTNLATLISKLVSFATKRPKMLLAAVSAISIVVTNYISYNAGKKQGAAEANAGITQKIVIAVLGGALGVGLLQLGYKLLKHVFTKSAAEVASSNRPKDEKLKTLQGLLSTAQKNVAKAKTADDKQLAQASVDIIQRHINEVQSQAA